MPEHSACMDGFLVKTVSIPANHVDMCKYSNNKDWGYRRTSRNIISLVKKSAKGKTSGGSQLPSFGTAAGDRPMLGIETGPASTSLFTNNPYEVIDH